VYDPAEREAMTAYLASEEYRSTLLEGGTLERWTSPGGGFRVDFPVPGDTAADVLEVQTFGPGRKLGRAVGLIKLDDLLPRL
jgi:hypothetical protein